MSKSRFSINRVIVFVLIVGLILYITLSFFLPKIVSFNTVAKWSNKNYPNTIQVDSLQELLKSENVLLLDNRTEREYSISHIPNAVFVGDSLEQLLSQNEHKLKVVYCSIGYRSSELSKVISQNHKNVFNLFGGIFAWKNADFEVVNKNNLSTDSVHTYSKFWGQYLENAIKVDE